MAAAGARLLRAFATQVEAMRRLRNGSSQYMRIEHVHLEAGAQAGGLFTGSSHADRRTVMASLRPARLCRLRTETSNRRCKVYFVAGRRSKANGAHLAVRTRPEVDRVGMR